jgi:hypothetical protein
LEAFIEQARAYDAVDQTQLGELLKQAQTTQLTHPVPVIRAREIDRWASSLDYQNIFKNRQLNYSQKAKERVRWSNW